MEKINNSNACHQILSNKEFKNIPTFSVLYFSVILINNKSWKIHPSVHQLTGNDLVAPAISTTMLNHSVDPNSIMFRRSLFN